MMIVWRVLVFLAAAYWPLWCMAQVALAKAGPDPGNFLLQNMGIATLVMILVVLALSPLYWLFPWQGINRVRRQLGLWCFTYAVLHLLCYLLFIIGLSFPQFITDLSGRPYIIVGMAALVCLAALAASSPRAIAYRLGNWWKRIHWLIYPALLLALLHFFWIVRADLGEWGYYAACSLILLVVRIPVITHLLKRIGQLVRPH